MGPAINRLPSRRVRPLVRLIACALAVSSLSRIDRERGLRYVPNDKHKHPWQPGRKGTLCPADLAVTAQQLLDESLDSPKWPQRRWATDGRRAFCALPTRAETDEWHGYPVPFDQVPSDVLRRWEHEGRISRRVLRRDRLDQRSIQRGRQ